MMTMETVEFYYRVKLILLRNMKIKINCFWVVTLCPEGAVCASCGARCDGGCSALVPASLFESLTA